MIKLDVIFKLETEFFVLIFIGFYTRRFLLDKTFQKGLTTLIMDLLLPCNILASFFSAPKDALTGKILEMFLFSAAFSLLAFFLSGFLYKSFGRDKTPSLRYGTTGSNFGLLGTSITEGLFGGVGVLLASFYMLPARIIVWTLGISVFCKQGKHFNLKNLCNPCIVTVLAGAVVYFTGLRVPALVSETVSAIGRCNFAMSMLSIGMLIDDFPVRDFADPELLYYSMIRLLVMPFMAFLICRAVGVSKEAAGVAVLLSAMPAPPGSALLAEKYGTNAAFAVKCIAVSTIYSVVTIPIWCLIIR